MRITCRSRIKKLRKQNRCTQKDVAAVIKVAPRTYSDYETGRCRIPIDSLIQLARFYDVDLNYIAGISNIRKEYRRRMHGHSACRSSDRAALSMRAHSILFLNNSHPYLYTPAIPPVV